MIFVFVSNILIPLLTSPDATQALVVFQRFLGLPLFDLIVSGTITYVFYHQAKVSELENKQSLIN
jgi:hypothetical protein